MNKDEAKKMINFTIFGGSDLGFMTGTCPDCPDIFMTGDV